MNTTPDNYLAAVVVTYKRQELLRVLFDSYVDLTVLPNHFILVDNENSPETAQIVEEYRQKLPDMEIHYLPQQENTGGSGGFHAGVKKAYALGTEWVWLMDDDVAVYENAVETLLPWLERGVQDNHRVIQVRRQNFDNTEFYWQYHFMTGLGIPNPFAPSQYGADEEYKEMNTACFEGGVFHRSIIFEVGYPDARFFIYWDDTIYGYLASKFTTPIQIKDVLMRRTRTLPNIKVGSFRKLNSTSDVTRYYIMRNRGYMAQYFKVHGDYNPLLFTLGTILTFCKEIIRIFITKSFSGGFKAVINGLRDAKKLRKDKAWKPMPPLVPEVTGELSKVDIKNYKQ
jgi:glycosyltransferase involved in cell wall biosynthesis